MKAVLGLLLLLLCSAANADISFAQLAQLSVSAQSLEGEFTQQKYLKVVDASLQSSGRFQYRRGEFIRWQILKPIESEILITPSAIEDGRGAGLPGANSQLPKQLSAQMGEIFFSLLSANWDSLEKYFALSGGVSGQQWHAILKPLQVSTAQVFSRIELKGSSWISEIILHQPNGDITTIHLDNLS